MFNGDLDQCFVGLVAPVSFVALAHSAADAGLALLHHWFRATALSNHLHERLHKEGWALDIASKGYFLYLPLLTPCSSSRPLPITRHNTSATTTAPL